jgi:FkbM family methyltransferase
VTRRLRWLNHALVALSRRTAWVEAELAGLRQVVGPGSVCVDVGGEYGTYTYALAHLVGPRGVVHNVEPLHGLPSFVTGAVLRACGAPAVRRHSTALGDFRGLGTLRVPRRAGRSVHGRSFLAEGADGPGPNAEFTATRAEPVPVTTLDALVADENMDRLDFLKADIEGAEPALLRGAVKTIDRFRPTLLLEIEARHLHKYGAEPADVIRPLDVLGYQMAVWRDGTWVDVETVTAGQRNYLFTPTPNPAHRVGRTHLQTGPEGEFCPSRC